MAGIHNDNFQTASDFGDDFFRLFANHFTVADLTKSHSPNCVLINMELSTSENMMIIVMAINIIKSSRQKIPNLIRMKKWI